MESGHRSVTRESTADGERVLSVRSLRLQRGSRVVLTGINFEVSRGEVVGLMGLSGAGKTSVLRIIAGLERDHHGEVDFGPGQNAPADARRGESARTPRHAGMV